jgi:CBS domain containing-hemolysin-like protein
MHNIYLALIALALVVLNGFFVAAEFAIVKLRQTQAEELSSIHGWKGRILLKVRSSLDAYLSACQLGITLASLGLGWIGEPAFAQLIEPILRFLGIESPEAIQGVSFAAAFTAISFLHIVLGELAPKSVAIRMAESISLWTAPPLYVFYWIMYPFIWVLNASTNLFLRSMGVAMAGEGEAVHSVEELKKVFAASHVHGELGSDSARLLAHAMELDELTAGDLMRPDSEMVRLDLGADIEANLALIRKYRYSRYPVYEGEPGNIVGVIHIKDLIIAVEKPGAALALKPYVKSALLVDQSMTASRILQHFREGWPHFAMIINEYGTVEGFVTLDHILEALIGKIQDEFRHRSPTWEKLPGGHFVGSGSLPIYSLERLLNIDINAEDVNSVGGLVLYKLEKIPEVGDTVKFDTFEIEVKEMDGTRINKIGVRPVQAGGKSGNLSAGGL